ncbi:MAG: MurR/RpiR family transcriptional regulator, partial [Comamonas sp.]|nr:MurR/RpiR family transcriptional regulator [Candidatus Comamonas equi]
MHDTTAAHPLEARIRHVYRDLPDAERKLADVVLLRHRELLGYSATELAELAGTSKSSAARFFRSLGYAGYEEFRQALRATQLQQSPLARMGNARRKDGLAPQFQQHLQLDAARLTEWADAVPEAQL